MTVLKTLGGRRVCLRPLSPPDAGPMALYAADPRVARMTTSIPHPYHPDMATAYIKQVIGGEGDTDVWAIDATPIDGPAFIGVISVRKTVAELGYWIGPPFWSTGYATEAAATLSHHLLVNRGWQSLNALVFSDNPGSYRVLQKVGFMPVGPTTLYCVARRETVAATRLRLTADNLVSGFAGNDTLKSAP